MSIRIRFLAPLALLITAQAALPAPRAHAFDLEDYATTWRATRDAWNKALNEVRLALGPFLAARMRLDAYGMHDYLAAGDIPLGSDIRPAWCDTWEGQQIGHPTDIGLESFQYSGAFDFYGRGHSEHENGKGLGHFHGQTALDLDTTAQHFVDGYDAVKWWDTLQPGSSAHTSALVSSDVAYYEAHGKIQRHCMVCEICGPDEPCAPAQYGNCWNQFGQMGVSWPGACPEVVNCGDRNCCEAKAECTDIDGQCYRYYKNIPDYLQQHVACDSGDVVQCGDASCCPSGSTCNDDNACAPAWAWNPKIECDSSSETDVACGDGTCCPGGSKCDGDKGCALGETTSTVQCTEPATIAEVLEYDRKYDLMPMPSPNTSFDMCYPEWYWGSVGHVPGDPDCTLRDPNHPDLGCVNLEDIFTSYRARRDAMLKSLNELTLATPPYRAATAAYAAAVEVYSANEPCGTWGLPNLPDLPNPFEEQAKARNAP